MDHNYLTNERTSNYSWDRSEVRHIIIQHCRACSCYYCFFYYFLYRYWLFSDFLFSFVMVLEETNWKFKNVLLSMTCLPYFHPRLKFFWSWGVGRVCIYFFFGRMRRFGIFHNLFGLFRIKPFLSFNPTKAVFSLTISWTSSFILKRVGDGTIVRSITSPQPTTDLFRYVHYHTEHFPCWELAILATWRQIYAPNLRLSKSRGGLS